MHNYLLLRAWGSPGVLRTIIAFNSQLSPFERGAIFFCLYFPVTFSAEEHKNEYARRRPQRTVIKTAAINYQLNTQRLGELIYLAYRVEGGGGEPYCALLYGAKGVVGKCRTVQAAPQCKALIGKLHGDFM